LLRRLETRSSNYERYEPKGEIASGGQGTILQVWDEDLRRHLAMKVLLGNSDVSERRSTPVDSRALARFLDEAQVTGQLDHPGIVPVHELGVDDAGRVYFTMQLVRGENLRSVFEKVERGEEGWTLTRVVSVFLKICEAMAYAHAKGVIHRDLKPANIMVGRYGEVFVMDWGLARIVDREDRRDIRLQEETATSQIRTERGDLSADSPVVTMDGDVVGTPSYMSPEQALGRLHEMGPHSDVYSVGAMLYHLLARHAPYVKPGMHVSARTVLYRLQEGPPDALDERAPDAPAELIAISSRAMEREPLRRYRDTSALAADLSAFLEGRVVSAYETGATAELRKWVRRNRGTAAALAALVVLAIGAGLTFAVVESNRKNEVSAAYTELARERDENQALSDVMTSNVLLDEVSLLVPSSAGIERMRRWVERTEDVLSRRDFLRARLLPDAVLWASISRAELEQHLARADELAAVESQVRHRLAAAESLYARSIEQRENDWLAARADVRASGAYGGLELTPQLGLVPLRKDPGSGLWEFWHVLSGEEPRASTDGYEVTPESGMVLVLLPGGEFVMGSPPDEVGHEQDEVQHDVTVAPFFLSKYETTQSQWERTMGANPSYFRPGEAKGAVVTSLVHPVDSVDCLQAETFATLLDLRLPTEEEWEFACRAGSDARFHWGPEDSDLEARENLADQSWSALVAAPNLVELGRPAPWDDGYPATSPVGSFEANAFGLFDMHGNVGEWTSSAYARDYSKVGRGTTQALDRVARGGNHHWGPSFARSALRQPVRPANSNRTLGVRLGCDVVRG
jgi:formylglycine-generating enzyme required for sulfatase activity/serine/threonine protein kinase